MNDTATSVDPTDCTDFHRTPEQLQRFALFCVFVAGKDSRVTAAKLDKFLSVARPGESPFDLVTRLAEGGNRQLENWLMSCRTGKYAMYCRGLPELAKLDVATCSRDQLMRVDGISYKTANYFLLHTRENYRGAALDTHILKYLRARGVAGVPKHSPQSARKHVRLEKKFLAFADALGVTPAWLDLNVWLYYSRHGANDRLHPTRIGLRDRRAA